MRDYYLVRVVDGCGRRNAATGGGVSLHSHNIKFICFVYVPIAICRDY